MNERIWKCGLTGKNTILVRYLLIYNPEQPIIAKEAYDEVEIFFRPKDFRLDEARIKKTIDNLIRDEMCTGASLERLKYGEVKVFFNPTLHARGDRQVVIKKIKRDIVRSNISSRREV